MHERVSVDALISIVFGLLLIRSTTAVETINRFLPNVSLAILVILMVLLVIGVFLGEFEWASGMKSLAVVLSILIVLWIFSESYWKRFGIPNIFGTLSPETKGIIVFIVILIIIVSYVSRDEEDKKGFGQRLDNIGRSIIKEK